MRVDVTWKGIMRIGAGRATVPVAWALGSALALWLADDGFAAWYTKSLRRDVFTAFLGTSGFIFTVYTFVVVKVVEGVLASAKHAENRRSAEDLAKQLDVDPPAEGDGLRSLSRLMGRTVLTCVVVAALNFALAFVPTKAMACLACASVGAGALAVLIALYWAQQNFLYWVECGTKST